MIPSFVVLAMVTSLGTFSAQLVILLMMEILPQTPQRELFINREYEALHKKSEKHWGPRQNGGGKVVGVVL